MPWRSTSKTARLISDFSKPTNQRDDMITDPTEVVQTIIDGIKKSSRMFQEPPQPKPSVRDQFELIEDSMGAIVAEMRRLENRIVILRAQIEGTEVGK